MTAWFDSEALHEEFRAYLVSNYGDSDGDYSIENNYFNVVDIVQQAGQYDDMFDSWVDEEKEADRLFEHPVQAMYTRDRALSDYADEHPHNDDVTDWDSVSEAPEPAKFKVGDVVWVNSPGDRDHGLKGEIVTVDESDDTYELDFDEYEEENGRRELENWFSFTDVTDTNPGQPAVADTTAAPAASDTTEHGVYPSMTATLPLDQSRLMKDGDRVIALTAEPGVRDKDALGTIDHVDVNDRSMTYSIIWDGKPYPYYAYNEHIKAAPSEGDAKAELLRQKLEFARDYLQARKHVPDDEWKSARTLVLNAYEEYGMTEELVDAIADAIRPPKSHSAPISL